MTQFEFDKLLEKYLAGECDSAEERLIEDWTEKQIAQATSFPLNEKEEKEIAKRLKRHIDTNTIGIWRLSFNLSFYRLGIAACLLGFIAFGAWFLLKNAQNTEGGVNTKNFELSNNTNTEQEFKLKDGSTITLKPQSHLTYLENFSLENRIVFLKGEGYFQVKRDTTKPFYVYAGDLVTMVLGTSFNIKTFEDGKKTEVVVTSGKVMVYENLQGKAGKSVILTSNQKVLQVNKQILTPQLVEQPIVIQPIEKKEDFIFEKTPLNIVLSRLKKVYAIDIMMKNNTIEHCLFTGDLNGLTLNEQLHFICKTIEAKSEKYETAIWISGEGCL